MSHALPVPSDPLAFIKRCVEAGQVYWTYHVQMRLEGRSIERQAVIGSVAEYEIIESYPDDKYLPSYLVFARWRDSPFHVLFAADVEEDHVRVVTAYRPDPRLWMPGLKRRKHG